MWNTLPLFGTLVLFAVMVAAAYTFAVSLSAGRSGSIRTLEAARFGGWIMLELGRPSGDFASYFQRAFHQASALLLPASAHHPQPAAGIEVTYDRS
jgi:hypothetical protein